MANWYVKARTNSNLRVADLNIEQTMESLTIKKLFNGVGTWQLQLRMTDAHAATFLPVSGGFPNGIIAQVDNLDGNGLQTVLSGPQRSAKVSVTAQNEAILVASGVSDEYWLFKRLAVQAPSYAYAFDTNFLATRQYPFNETSGTTATDVSGNSQNGTYHGGFTLNQSGLIDDPGGCVLLNGTTGYVSGNATTGLPTVNASWAVMCWGMVTSNPSAEVDLIAFGTNANKQGVHAGLLSGGFPFYAPFFVTATQGATAVTLNVPFLLAVTWDGTTMTGYLCQNNVVSVFGTSTPGAMNVTYGALQFGANLGPANFWPGYMAQGAFQPALAQAVISQFYNQGLSRYFLNTDVITNTHASTSLIALVNQNAATSAQPQTTFTNVYSTHTARPIPNISVASDPLVGSNINILPHQDNLLDLLAASALQSSPELGFKLEQSGSNLVFTVYQPTDLSATAIFSRDFYGAQGNLLDYDWEYVAGVSNHIIAGGANPLPSNTQASNRLYAENENATSITEFGYMEAFLDYRQAADNITLQQAIAGQLAADAAIFNVNFTTIDQSVLYFKGPTGSGYDLGNKVTVLLDGLTFQQIIREIDINLQPGAPAVIQIAVGTPLNATITNNYSQIARDMESLSKKTHHLNINY